MRQKTIHPAYCTHSQVGVVEGDVNVAAPESLGANLYEERRGGNIGKTDGLCMNVVEDKVHVHDLTILHCLRLEHTRTDIPSHGPRFPRRAGEALQSKRALCPANASGKE